MQVYSRPDYASVGNGYGLRQIKDLACNGVLVDSFFFVLNPVRFLCRAFSLESKVVA
jgi:hypothetical protein